MHTYIAHPMVFWVQTGPEEVCASGTTYVNRAEAAAVEKTVTRILKAGVGAEKISVITLYEGKRARGFLILQGLAPFVRICTVTWKWLLWRPFRDVRRNTSSCIHSIERASRRWLSF